MTWREVLDVWIKEKSSFTYNGQNDVKLVGNYTQVLLETFRLETLKQLTSRIRKSNISKYLLNYI